MIVLMALVPQFITATVGPTQRKTQKRKTTCLDHRATLRSAQQFDKQLVWIIARRRAPHNNL